MISGLAPGEVAAGEITYEGQRITGLAPRAILGGAAGEQDGRPLLAFDQADQDGGRLQLVSFHAGPATWREVEVRAPADALRRLVLNRVKVGGDPFAQL